MARRRYAEDPFSRLAIWARRFAFFSLVATLLSIIIVRSGLLEIQPSLVTFAGALGFAALGILTGLAAFIVIWIHGLRGLGYAVSAIFIGLTLLAYPAFLGYKAYMLPVIADITTDPIDPPRFEAVARVRPRNANPVIYAGLYAAEQQRMAYPEIEPLLLSAPPKAVYDAALAIAGKRKWLVVDARAPLTAGRREGRIEAITRTPIMGFRDDIVIRIRPSDEDSRVDMRSASRYGRHDFGTNAARIRSLFAELEETIETLQERQERQEQRKPQQQQQRASRPQPPKR